MDPERETKFRSAFGELRPWVDASLTVAKALLTQSRHYYCLGRGPTKGGELPVSLPSAGVLIRALEPLEGIPIMRLNRGIERLRDLARGPGRLTAALRVGRWPDGLDLWRRSSFVLGCVDICAAVQARRKVAVIHGFQNGGSLGSPGFER